MHPPAITWPDLHFGPINLWNMPKMEESAPLYEKIIYRNEDKNYELRLVVNEFRDEYYVHIRKYFQSYEGAYVPSKEGISMVATISNVNSLLDGLIEIASKEEAIDLINKHFSDRISSLQSPSV
jgi:hypothetical protein